MNAFFNKLLTYLKSLRLHIIIMVMAVGIIPVLVISAVFLRAYEDRAIYRDSTDITATTSVLTGRIQASGYLSDQSDSDTTSVIRTYAKANAGRVMVINGALKVVKDTYGLDDGKLITWENVIKAINGESSYYYDDNTEYLTVTVPIYEKSSSDVVVGALLITRDENHISSNLEYLYYMLALVIFIDALVCLAIAIVGSARIAVPIGHLKRKLDTGNRLTPSKKEIGRYTEIQDVSDAIDDFSRQMKVVDESRQEFVSNVSHELKTPLAAMKVLADSLVGQENVPVEIYQDFMLDITDEIDRENKIISDLLALVKSNRANQQLKAAPVNMNELIEHLLKRIGPIAEQADVDIVLESYRPVVAEIDEVRFSLAITNLVENAVKYNNPGGWVHVSLNCDHEYCYIKVEDNGLGIPEEDIPHIYERFYRVDKSHSREIGGTGLGLAITYEAVAAHHGEIKVSSEEGAGTTFDVRLPLKYIP